MTSGPLSGVRVVEFAGIGPAPFCTMLLSDMGAEIIRIDRPGGNPGGAPYIPAKYDVLARGRRSVSLDLKIPDAVQACLELADKADIVIEGFRPGVMERLGLGPDVMLARNSRLVFGRMTGWGQTGPMSARAGHDLNYIAISGAAHAIGTREKPVPPLSLIGDFGGGALYLAVGVLAALHHARSTGQGQVVDCAMSDGAASLMASVYSMRAIGMWENEREANLIDGASHFYDSYRCADGKWVSIAAIEPAFYAQLVALTGLDDPDLKGNSDRSKWPSLKAALKEIFATRTRAEWCIIMEGADACFAPVLDVDEAPEYAHNLARQMFVDIGGVIQPGPAPKFSLTPGEIQSPPPENGEHSVEVLNDWGVSDEIVERLFRQTI